MVNENLKTIIENKKPFETIYELKDGYKVPSFEEFMESYEGDKKLSDNYELEIDSYGNIGVEKGYGPMDNAIYLSRGPCINIEYNVALKFSNGLITNQWDAKNMAEVRELLRQMENNETTVIRLDSVNTRVKWLEEDIKKELRESARLNKFPFFNKTIHDIGYWKEQHSVTYRQ